MSDYDDDDLIGNLDDSGDNSKKGSGSDSGDDKSDKGSNSGENKEEEGDSKRNEVRKEFTSNFEKKIAKLIPPQLKFKGNISKRKLIKEQTFQGFVSNLNIFRNYLLLTVDSELRFYKKDVTLTLVFSLEKFVKENEEIFSLNLINDETIVMATTDRVRVYNFYEKEPTKITSELIQEITGTELYGVNEKLNNGLLLIGGYDRKYGFYELPKKNERVSKDNKYQLSFVIDKVHNVYDDDVPGIVDLNNGRLFSWLNDDKNIKVIQYSPPSKVGIIKSQNKIGLHNAGLISDKYLILMGLIYPTYYSWLMDTETLEIVKKWKTPQNDSFNCLLCENKFLYSSTYRIGCDEFYIENGEFKRKTIYETYFKEDQSEDFDGSFGVRTFLDETTFITLDFDGKLMFFSCEQD